MPITVHEIGPDGTLVQTTIGDDAPAPDAAPPATPPAGDPGASAPPAPDAPPAAPAPGEEAPPDSAPDVPEPPVMTEEEDDEAPVALSKGVQRRIDRLTRQREEARRREAALEERLRMLEQGYQRPEPPPPAAAPATPASARREDYATDEEWIQAVTQQAVSREREQWQLDQLRQRQQQEHQQREAQWATREQAFKQQHPDYDEQVQSLAGRLAPQLWQGLSDSEQAPELAYHLARHPAELQRLNGLQPLALSRALGRLEQQLSVPARPAPPPPTPKPAPPTPLNGAGSPGPRLLTELSDADIDAMSQAEFEAAYKRQFPRSR